MNPSSLFRLPRLRAFALFLGLAGLVLVADRLTKHWAVERLAPPGALEHPRGMPWTPAPEQLHLIPGCLRLEYATNTGAAFSLFHEHPEMLTLLAAVLSVGILVWSLRLPPGDRAARVALALIFGGALGNLHDRLRYQFVIDFIVAYVGPRQWPTFNIADSAICVGIGLFLWLAWREGRHAPPPDRAPEG